MRGRLLKSSNRLTTYSLIELKLGTIMLVICSHNHSASDFSISYRGALWAASRAMYKSIHSLQLLCD